MSIEAVTWAFKQKLDDPTAKLVLLGIADKYNEDRGYAWPSMERLADMADCTQRTVSRKISMLEELGVIETIRHPNQTNRYFLPYMTSCRPDTGVYPDQTPSVLSDRTSSVIQTIDNNNEQYISFKNDFDLFWKEVPRKVGKKGAMRAFKAACKDSSAEKITASMTAFAADCKLKGTEQRFIPMPASWLNAGRYDDELIKGEAKHENFGISQRWMPRDQDEFNQKYNAMPDYYQKSRPDIVALAKQKGWL